MSNDPMGSQASGLAEAPNPFYRFAFWSLLAAWGGAGVWDVSQHGLRQALAHGGRYFLMLSFAFVVLLLVYGLYRLTRLGYLFRR